MPVMLASRGGVASFIHPIRSTLFAAIAILAGFLDQMKKTQGDATLLERQDDPKLPGVRFTARGGVYTLRANLIVQGWEGWAVYAGTQRGKPIDSIELDFALRAREHTVVGRPESSGK